MSSTLKPLTLHAHMGPSPWKIAILLSELSISYQTHVHTSAELNEPSFLALNPVGMTPVVEDPNTGVVLAESTTITDYILTHYDPQHKLSFEKGSKEEFLMKQWLAYQATTQSPLSGAIYRWGHLQSNPEAKASYVADFCRMLKVLDGHLSEKGEGEGERWLVGGKCSAADLSFVPFHCRMGLVMGEDCPDVEKDFPAVNTWYSRMCEREMVAKVTAEHDEVLKSFVPPTKKE